MAASITPHFCLYLLQCLLPCPVLHTFLTSFFSSWIPKLEFCPLFVLLDRDSAQTIDHPCLLGHCLSSMYQNPGHGWVVSCQCCEHGPRDSKGTGSMPPLSQALGISGSQPGAESWLHGPALNYRMAELSPGSG